MKILLLALLPLALFAQTPAIILPADPKAPDVRAAEVLRPYLAQMTQADVPILRTGRPPKNRPLIFIGNNRALRRRGIDLPEQLPDEAIFLAGKNGVFALAGGGELGPEYAVYSLLELLGCRKYTPRDSFIPSPDVFQLPELAPRIETPAFPYRELWYEPAFDEGWARWHRLKRPSDKQAEWGLFVHTFHILCPPETYFDQHPEYFAWNGAQRSPGQLCLSNDTVRQIVIQSLREKMAAKPSAEYWSVSQNDNFDYCRCARCAAADARYGSPAGTLLAFVNEVAAAFPDKTISTLAYQYTRHAPRGIRPARNVSVCLCSIECNRGESIAEGCPDFARDLDEWSALTANLMVWDYVVQFRSYLSPFPNWHTLQPNLQLFREHGVRMMFEQGSGRDKSEFSDMRAYLLAKLMWNPSANMDSILTDFGDGYYGAARPFVWDYIHQLTEALLSGDRQLTIYNIPQNEPFLTQERLANFFNTIGDGLEAVRLDTVLQNRVGEIFLTQIFAMMECSKNDSARLEQLLLYHPLQMERTIRTFDEGCRRVGLKNLHEGGYSPEQYVADYLVFIDKSRLARNSLASTVHLQNSPSPSYAHGRADELINRRIGETDYRYNWLGFQGNDLVATIGVLGDSVSKIQVSFLQDQMAWVFFPEKVVVEISTDGEHFETVHSEVIPLVPDGKKAVKAVTVDLGAARPARWVRVRAVNTKTCPPWHSCTGNPCWIFADEIVVL